MYSGFRPKLEFQTKLCFFYYEELDNTSLREIFCWVKVRNPRWLIINRKYHKDITRSQSTRAAAENIWTFTLDLKPDTLISWCKMKKKRLHCVRRVYVPNKNCQQSCRWALIYWTRTVEIWARDNDVSDIVLHLSSLSTEFILWELPCFNGPGGAVMASLHRSSSVTMLQSIADDAAI